MGEAIPNPLRSPVLSYSPTAAPAGAPAVPPAATNGRAPKRTALDEAARVLRACPRRWLVTGAAGFIGSNLVEALLSLGQDVVGMDDLSTGHVANLDDAVALARTTAGEGAGRFRFLEADVRDLAACRAACDGVDVVLHQAALGSVPRSIEDPATTHAVNVDGFVNVLVSARDAGVGRFVYASSSSVYGDHPGLPKREDEVGEPLSPYAVTKRVGEYYALTFQEHYGQETVGLRYFNVFGRRQDPDGPYAAVIPRWIGQMLAGERCTIYGDGETSRDFCYVANVVQANLLAALAPAGATGRVYNVACGDRTTLNELHAYLRAGLRALGVEAEPPRYEDFRPGDVRYSQADTSRARWHLGYAPTHSAEDGLREALGWYVQRHVEGAPATGPASEAPGHRGRPRGPLPDPFGEGHR